MKFSVLTVYVLFVFYFCLSTFSSAASVKFNLDSYDLVFPDLVSGLKCWEGRDTAAEVGVKQAYTGDVTVNFTSHTLPLIDGTFEYPFLNGKTIKFTPNNANHTLRCLVKYTPLNVFPCMKELSETHCPGPLCRVTAVDGEKIEFQEVRYTEVNGNLVFQKSIKVSVDFPVGIRGFYLQDSKVYISRNSSNDLRGVFMVTEGLKDRPVVLTATHLIRPYYNEFLDWNFPVSIKYFTKTIHDPSTLDFTEKAKMNDIMPIFTDGRLYCRVNQATLSVALSHPSLHSFPVLDACNIEIAPFSNPEDVFLNCLDTNGTLRSLFFSVPPRIKPYLYQFKGNLVTPSNFADSLVTNPEGPAMPRVLGSLTTYSFNDKDSFDEYIPSFFLQDRIIRFNDYCFTIEVQGLKVNYLFYYYPKFLVTNPTSGDPSLDVLKTIELQRKQSTMEIFPFVVVSLIFLSLILRRRRMELLKQAKFARRGTSKNRFKKL